MRGCCICGDGLVILRRRGRWPGPEKGEQRKLRSGHPRGAEGPIMPIMPRGWTSCPQTRWRGGPLAHVSCGKRCSDVGDQRHPDKTVISSLVVEPLRDPKGRYCRTAYNNKLGIRQRKESAAVPFNSKLPAPGTSARLALPLMRIWQPHPAKWMPCLWKQARRLRKSSTSIFAPLVSE